MKVSFVCGNSRLSSLQWYSDNHYYTINAVFNLPRKIEQQINLRSHVLAISAVSIKPLQELSAFMVTSTLLIQKIAMSNGTQGIENGKKGSESTGSENDNKTERYIWICHHLYRHGQMMKSQDVLPLLTLIVSDSMPDRNQLIIDYVSSGSVLQSHL